MAREDAQPALGGGRGSRGTSRFLRRRHCTSASRGPALPGEGSRAGKTGRVPGAYSPSRRAPRPPLPRPAAGHAPAGCRGLGSWTRRQRLRGTAGRLVSAPPRRRCSPAPVEQAIRSRRALSRILSGTGPLAIAPRSLRVSSLHQACLRQPPPAHPGENAASHWMGVAFAGR